MNVFYVYALFRPWDGSPFYVGKGKGRRWLEHEMLNRKHSNRHLINIIKKAKLIGVEIPKIKLRDSLSENDAFAIEIAFIAAIGRGKNGPLVNATDGGEGAAGFTRSATTRAKQSIAMMGNKNSLGAKRSEETRMKLRSKQNSPETRAKIGDAHRGKALSDDHRKKLSEAKKGKPQNPEAVAKRAASNRGKKRSVEAKENMSRGQIGNKNGIGHTVSQEARDTISRKQIGNKNALGTVHSLETRAKMSAWQIGRKMSLDFCAKRSAGMKDKWTDPEYRKRMLLGRKKQKVD